MQTSRNIPASLIQLAETRAGGSQSRKQAWLRTIEQMRTLRLSLDAESKLIQETSNPGSLINFARAMASHPEPWKALTDAVDQSPHSLEDWLHALERLQEYILQKGKHGSWQHQIGYISCCSKSQRHSGLFHAVEDALDAYGYDGESVSKE